MIEKENIAAELKFRTSRSSGKGGQNVNKVASKVELIFDVMSSAWLTDDEKNRICAKATAFIPADGAIHIVCQEDRSQYMNKKTATEKLIALLEKCLKPTKKRIKTQLPAQVNEKRMADKKQKSELKQTRRRIEGAE
ncbi:MAG: alternative ribosome rescue aminoacyl-tRNA hydrolase ArfB [Bacteroidota bacterium]